MLSRHLIGLELSQKEKMRCELVSIGLQVDTKRISTSFEIIFFKYLLLTDGGMDERMNERVVYECVNGFTNESIDERNNECMDKGMN